VVPPTAGGHSEAMSRADRPERNRAHRSLCVRREPIDRHVEHNLASSMPESRNRKRQAWGSQELGLHALQSLPRARAGAASRGTGLDAAALATQFQLEPQAKLGAPQPPTRHRQANLITALSVPGKSVRLRSQKTKLSIH
jgi:hypothetical protein